MKVVPLPPEGLRVGRPLPFTVRDGAGLALIARGAVIKDDRQLQMLQSRPLYVDLNEGEAVKRAVNGQLDRLLLQDASIGRLADAKPDYDTLAVAKKQRGAQQDMPLDWPNLQMRLRLLLVDPHAAAWIERLRHVRDDILALVARHPDRALVRLIHDASNEFQDYSANHALLTCVLVSLSCTQVAGWRAEWHDPLTLAALTMNVSFMQMQDELARQSGGLGEHQQAVMLAHPVKSAELLAQAGVTDELWLHAVLHHHDAGPGPLAGREPGDLVARLVRRVDRYAARLSPRKSRPASSALAAAQVALLDEGGHTDEAGQAIVRTLGLYPPGAWVKLACGEIALVVGRTAVAKAPVAVSLVAKSGLALAVPALRNTRLPAYEVTGSVPPAQVKVRPNLDALEKIGVMAGGGDGAATHEAAGDVRRCVVDVWFVDLDGLPPLAGCDLSALRDDERLRLGGYLSTGPARRFALARAALRLVLGDRSGDDPGSILIGEDARGKPRRIDGTGGSFSVSHSGDRVTIAVSPTHELGVDIERLTSFQKPERLYKLACSAPERAWLAAHPKDAEREFGHLWVRKEASLKAVGMCLRTRPSTVDLTPFFGAAAGEMAMDGPMTGMQSRVLFQSLELSPDCRAAVAAIVRDRKTEIDVRCRVFDATRLAR